MYIAHCILAFLLLSILSKLCYFFGLIKIHYFNARASFFADERILFSMPSMHHVYDLSGLKPQRICIQHHRPNENVNEYEANAPVTKHCKLKLPTQNWAVTMRFSFCSFFLPFFLSFSCHFALIKRNVYDTILSLNWFSVPCSLLSVNFLFQSCSR